jgi:Kef-type K+ transport system membrane component KefB
MDLLPEKLAFLLPLKDPVYIFALLAGIILVVPFLSKLIRIPEIAWYIILGIAIGPNGFNLLAYDSSMTLLGTVGLMYIMFIAGLELNLRDFSRNRNHSYIFGLYTFMAPLILGFAVCRWVLNLENTASIIVAIILSAHTLIAYPIVSKLGVSRDKSVMTAVGGTFITYVLVFFLLTVITGDLTGQNKVLAVLRLLILFAGYLLVILLVYPGMSKWFFKYIKKEKPVQYIFLLLMVFLSASLARIAGVEPVIGAFVAGLALNRSVSKNPVLVGHVEFVGNALFIPIFLISVGMIINLRVLAGSLDLWLSILILLATALASKWISAFLAQVTLKYNTLQRRVMFGLTSSHAVATIAVITIGFSRNLVDINIYNGIIVIILASSMVASFVTESAGRKMLQMAAFVAPKEEDLRQRILVPAANPSNVKKFVEFALALRGSGVHEPVYALTVQEDHMHIKEKMAEINRQLEAMFSDYNEFHQHVALINRIDVNVAHGITRASKENRITDIVMGWGDGHGTGSRIVGSMKDRVIELSWLNLYLCHFRSRPESYRLIHVVLPPFAEKEPGFPRIFKRIINLDTRNDLVYQIFLTDDTSRNLKAAGDELKGKHIRIIPYNDIGEFLTAGDILREYSLSILFYPRRYHVSYSARIEAFQLQFTEKLKDASFVIVVTGHEEKNYFSTGIQGFGALER